MLGLRGMYPSVFLGWISCNEGQALETYSCFPLAGSQLQSIVLSYKGTHLGQSPR